MSLFLFVKNFFQLELKRKKLEKRFACTRCDKTFTAAGILKIHMQKHTGQFTYFCEMCQKGFGGSTHLQIHMRSHEGKKYFCEFCGKSFVNKQNLEHHDSIHTGRYKFHCGAGFNLGTKFELHCQSHKQEDEPSGE